MNASHTPASPEWLPFVNTTEEVIPGGAVLEPAGGYDSKGRIRVRKCTADDSLLVFFNGPMSVESASMGDPDKDKPGGLCRSPWPMAAAAVHGDDLAGYTYPANAGAKAGDWFLRLSRTGFKFLDQLADGTANVVPVPVAGGGGGGGGGGSGDTGSGGSGNGLGRFVGYHYRSRCVNGVLQLWRSEQWYSTTLGPTMTPYTYQYDDGCCECSGGGTGSGSGSGSGDFVDCASIPPTLTFSATLLSGSCPVGFPTGGSAVSAGYDWTFGGSASCAGPVGGWSVVLACDAGAGTLSATVYESQNFSPPVAIVTFAVTMTSQSPFSAAGVVSIPSLAGCCPSTTWLFQWNQ